MATITQSGDTDPWASYVATMTSVQYLEGTGKLIQTDPYPTFTQGMTLSQYSKKGYRVNKLLSRPPMREVYGYGESWEPMNQSVTRVFDTPSSSRKVAVDWWLGWSEHVYTTDVDGNPVDFLHRELPEQVPVYPWLFAERADFVEPRDLAIIQDPLSYAILPNASDFPPQYGAALGQQLILPMIFYAGKVPKAGPLDENGNRTDLFYDGPSRYRVTYNPRPYDLLTDDEAAQIAEQSGASTVELCRYVERQFTYEVRAQPMPTTLRFQWTEGPKETIGKFIDQQNPTLILPTKSLTYRWLEVPELPDIAISNCVGRVNDAQFDGSPGWPSYPAGTLLCQPAQAKWYPTKRGAVAWLIEYHFSYQPAGWNRFLHANGNWYAATLPSGRPLYLSAPFDTLFQLPAKVSTLTVAASQ